MTILDLLFPKNCLECGNGGAYICASCLQKVPHAGWGKNQTYSVWAYEGVIRKAIIALKYKFAFEIAKELADHAVNELVNCKFLPAQAGDIENCILVPIPLHKSRQNWRGFNQSEELAKLICKSMNLRLESNILVRPSATKQQVGLVRSERERNMRGKFAVITPREALAKWGKNTIVVFDDVATTGATLKEAISELKKNFPDSKIFGLTIAG